MSAWTEAEREAVHTFLARCNAGRGAVLAWIDGGPRPSLDALGGTGASCGGPWPTISVQIVSRGVEVYRRGPAEDAAGRAWAEYWTATIGHGGSAGSTQAQRDAAPPVPHEERDGEWHLIAWADVHALLGEHVHGDAQPALFDLPVAA